MLKLTWYSGSLVIEDQTCDPNTESLIERKLFYIEKQLVQDPSNPRARQVVKERVNLTRVLPGQPFRTLVTYQGFVDRVLGIWQSPANRSGSMEYQIEDLRDPLPNPQSKLMHGFWHTQFPTLLHFLKHKRSGTLKAPTRYGKTSLIINTLRAFPGVQTVLAAPGVDLLGQLQEELQAALPDRQITGIFSGAKKKTKFQSEDITICSMASLEKLNHDSVKLLLIDEPHAIATDSRILEIKKFQHARILGYGATLTGRFDGKDLLVEGLIGPVLYEKTFEEAVKDGAICPIVVYILRVKFDPFECWVRDDGYRELVYRSGEFVRIVQDIAAKIPQDWQTIVFADQKKQIQLLEAFVANGTPAIASDMNKAERDEKFRAMKAGEIKRCIATNIYSTGVTFPDLRCVINASGGGGSITGTQKPGRLAQKRPGKKCGYLVDFSFEARGREGAWEFGANEKWSQVVVDARNRLKVYEGVGYEIRYIDSVEQLNFE